MTLSQVKKQGTDIVGGGGGGITFDVGTPDGVPVEKTGASTLGEYTPPANLEFDAGTTTGDILKCTGATTLGKVTGIPESLIVANDEILTFTNTESASHEVGETVATTTFNWTMLRNANANTSQSISGTDLVGSPVSIAPGTTRTYGGTFTPNLSPAVATTYTYTLNTVGDDGYADSATTTIPFRWMRYWGVSDTDVLTGANVMSVLEPQNDEFATSITVSKTFDASVGTPPNYLYFAYPASFGAISSSTFNTFPFTDFEYSNGATYQATPTALTLTNASGGTTNYYIVRTVNTYNGSGLVWSIA
ncbi:MAG: hypothetical protein KBA02_00045 [Paludibacteraceae bacterium]|nr:hypothetical protein [Paludibacteraceae bacterium]